MDKNIQSWDNSDNSNYNKILNTIREIDNELSKIINKNKILGSESENKILESENKIWESENAIWESENNIWESENAISESENAIWEIENAISEIHNKILESENNILESENNILESENNYSFLNEPESFFSISKNSSYLKNGSKSNNNDHYISDIKSNWNNNLNSCIESYLSSQICIDSFKYNDSDFNSSFFGKVSNSGESKSTSIITSTNDPNASYLESSNDCMQKFKHLWVPCEDEDCYGLNYKKFLKSKMNICEDCGYHLKMSSSDRIELLIDPGTWNPMDEYMFSVDPIEWDSEEEPFKNRLDSYQKRTGLMEAIQTGTGQLNGIPLAIGIMEFQFMGGSMGSVVGEKITRLIEYATNQRLPLILVCASGGARMQEGSLSLMQMAKISSALYDYQINQKLFYVPILTSPTTGGVTASFGMLGDIIIAEPNAYIAFAGKRVIEQTLNITVPEGSQSAEFLFQMGLFDSIVPRSLLKAVLTELFQLHGFVPLTQNEK
uniref:Acetyl-coenzyme A carboxylase carboxyl transferase subunit beta n=1 Tax=Astragalus pattersonii TaxID=2873425 RepID=A0A8K1JFI8_9FABA|nr:acetyl-CoA carboxylase carboxyltransferase beta subunit [Astragalus pattersonii]UCS40896.1 acetyl-CoA carboxylase carboxyltransferase beta subunit [Astragalus pattersonii]